MSYCPQCASLEAELSALRADLAEHKAERAEMLWVLREAMLFVVPDYGNGPEVIRRFEPFRAIHEYKARKLLKGDG